MKRKERRLEPSTTIIPFALISLLCISFFLRPESSSKYLDEIRAYIGDSFGSYYLIIGLGVLIASFAIAFSRIGRIRLGGKNEKPRHSFLAWGAMVFTCGLAADILFYSFCEWIYYMNESHVKSLGDIRLWASSFPIFHWGPIPWSFYAVLAACFGFMLHVRNVNKQRFSEACRPLLGKQTDGVLGKAIDVIAVIALIAGTATTFSVATPLLSTAVSDLLKVDTSKYITIAILVLTCISYTYAVLKGIKGVSWLANACMYLFFGLMLYVLLFGGKTRFIIENGIYSIGNVINNFIGLSTFTDPLRENFFPQNWTIFYWAYWMVWCVAAPFFMGSISRGMTIRQIILGAYAFGLSSTLISFVVFGNFGLGLQLFGELDVLAIFEKTQDLYKSVISMVKTLPFSSGFIVVLVLSMIAFYATSFDSITLVASQYSYKELKEGEEATKKMKLFWALLLILLPIALLFSESSMKNMQSVSIIAAFPLGLVIVLIIGSFIKDANSYIKENREDVF